MVPGWRFVALGQKQTCAVQKGMSALPRKRTRKRTPRDGQSGPLARVDRLNEILNLPNLCSRSPTDEFALSSVETVFEIPIAVAPRAARALGPAMHSAPCPARPFASLP